MTIDDDRHLEAFAELLFGINPRLREAIDAFYDSDAGIDYAAREHELRLAIARVVRAHRRGALLAAANELEHRMHGFPLDGRHTRAGWAVNVLRDLGTRGRP